ncbi:hypothetical protein CDD82_6960 [Ophiocordyceps australis]|uniref:Uncharacterized protein n=1 Tax=Ophiocordyceps australis TaxID=1399860 RepID=A0A2C5YPP0_9HYPO|nr:hypothetical protein CDD82_6960 [Ophiocordyceps australis]
MKQITKHANSPSRILRLLPLRLRLPRRHPCPAPLLLPLLLLLDRCRCSSSARPVACQSAVRAQVALVGQDVCVESGFEIRLLERFEAAIVAR